MMDIVIDFLSQAAEILAANLSSSFSPFFLDYLELFLSRLKVTPFIFSKLYLKKVKQITQLSPGIFDPRKKYPNFLQVNFEYLTLLTARNDINK